MMTLKRFKIGQIVALTMVLYLLGLAAEADAYKMKSNRQNRVRVDVRPVQLVAGKPAKFEVRMNTHSVSLNQDLVAVCILKDNQGREYQPMNWQGSPPGGHHRQGVLEFPTLDGNPTSIILVIRDIAEVPERTFRWSIGN
ncbi:MAG: hypothetical protein JSV31_07135 [Desulfobacterales bacterium]|nr:MAG: hypothetical protein JSV31_07135 [Desulfobacterales bacterium]